MLACLKLLITCKSYELNKHINPNIIDHTTYLLIRICILKNGNKDVPIAKKISCDNDKVHTIIPLIISDNEYTNCHVLVLIILFRAIVMRNIDNCIGNKGPNAESILNNIYVVALA